MSKLRIIKQLIKKIMKKRKTKSKTTKEDSPHSQRVSDPRAPRIYVRA